jgi:hypothetical protein
MARRAILEFLKSHGFEIQHEVLEESSFLPGITIRNGAILVDEKNLLYPGDLLHEAGHLAVMTSEERRGATAPLNIDPGFEMAAIAWSYAAAVYLGLELDLLFHPNGYKGESEALIENFSTGHYFGVPVLEWAGLTRTGERASQAGVAPYPHMVRWLRE